MSINKLLLWEKWRPKKIEDIILLPRIRNHFQDGVNNNYIFYGNYGTGKTSLARILIGRYSKDKPYLELNSSLFTSIDVLRSKIEDFCKFTPMMESDSDIKYIFLDEFERVSPQFQDAFKAFIEKYNNKVRFIITTNHINKITDGIKSRIPQLNFDCQDVSEERYLKQEIFKRIKNVILKEEGEIPKDGLISIINKKFPDFRSILLEVQNYIQTGGESKLSQNVSNKLKLELYDIIYSDYDYEKVYHFLMSNFGADKIDIMIGLLGKPFIDWSLSEGKNVEKLFEVSYLVCKYDVILQSATDPIIVGVALVGRLKKLYQ